MRAAHSLARTLPSARALSLLLLTSSRISAEDDDVALEKHHTSALSARRQRLARMEKHVGGGQLPALCSSLDAWDDERGCKQEQDGAQHSWMHSAGCYHACRAAHSEALRRDASVHHQQWATRACHRANHRRVSLRTGERAPSPLSLASSSVTSEGGARAC